jgi:two-component system phosphate regulon sensor histidine kinase PhoR
MSDMNGQRQNWGRLALERLQANGWLMAASAVAVIAVHAFSDLSPFVAPLAIVGLAIAVMALPRQTERTATDHGASAQAGLLPQLSAENLAAAVTDPLIVFDHMATVVHANAAAISIFGNISPGMSLPLKFRAPEMQALIEEMLAGSVSSRAIDYIDKLPVERVYRISASAIGHGTGLYVLVFKDQSEARRIDRMRADFIANASHEMRTPLASISGFIETLRGPARNDPAAREQFLQIMQNQAGRMARLIDDLLSLSRLEMKSFHRSGVRVDLRNVVESVIDSLAPLAKDSGLKIERNFADGALEVPGDRDELYQVFENLLENACKYGQSGERIIVSIAPSTKGPEPGIDVTIRDFGPGIAEEHIPRVTERFYRVDVETSRSQKGTGLGLSIVKHILTRHNGRLSIESELGKGAAFTVHLPTN